MLDELLDCFTPRPLGQDRFSLVTPDWWRGRVFGGMVVAQALAGALATVTDKRLHSLHGPFLAPTPPGRAVEVAVTRVRDGRSFAAREAESTVDGRAVFRLWCSFHEAEDGDDYQVPMPENVPDPETLERTELFGGFDVREIGPVRSDDGTFRSTRRAWVRTQGPMPDDPRLHDCVVAYLSDMTASGARPHSLGVWGTHTDASLDHALWFHRPVRADEWLYYDLHALVNAEGRSTVRGELYSLDGLLRASMAQEMLIRPLADPEPETVPGWGTPD